MARYIVPAPGAPGEVDPLFGVPRLEGAFAKILAGIKPPRLPPTFPRPTLPPRSGDWMTQPVRGAADPLAGDMNAAAAAIAAGMIDPQTAAINRAIQAKEMGIQGQAKAAEGVMAALQRLGGGIPAAIQAAYAQAGHDQAGYASGLTGAVGDAARSAASEAGAQIAAQGAPGAITSDAPAAMGVANYLGGFLPSSNLAAEAASRFTEATQTGYAANASLAQQALDQMNVSRSEVEELRMRGLDIEMTRPGEVQKALLQLRAESREERAAKLAETQADREYELALAESKRQEKALGLQEGTLSKQWTQTLDDMAWNRTNATGTLWVVRNGKLVDTRKPAPGSAAGRAATSAAVSLTNSQRTAAQRAADRKASARQRAADRRARTADQNADRASRERIAETNARVREAQDAAANVLARERIGISKGNLELSQQREARMARGPKSQKNPNGFTPKQLQDWRGDAREAYENIVFQTDEGKIDGIDFGGERIPTPRAVVKAAMTTGAPYSLIFQMIKNLANTTYRGNTEWAYAAKHWGK